MVACGTPVQPLPSTSTMSMAPKRSSISPWSSTSISSGSPVTRSLLCLVAIGRVTFGGLGQESEVLFRVLEAKLRDPAGRAPTPH